MERRVVDEAFLWVAILRFYYELRNFQWTYSGEFHSDNEVAFYTLYDYFFDGRSSFVRTKTSRCNS